MKESTRGLGGRGCALITVVLLRPTPAPGKEWLSVRFCSRTDEWVDGGIDG